MNWTLFSTPLRGISTFTKLFSARKTQRITSKVLNKKSEYKKVMQLNQPNPDKPDKCLHEIKSSEYVFEGRLCEAKYILP